MTGLNMAMIDVAPGALPNLVSRFDQLALLLADVLAGLAEAPRTLQAAAADQAGPLPLEVAELLHGLDGLIQALLSLARRAAAADASYAAAENQAAEAAVAAALRAPMPWPRQASPWEQRGHAILRTSDIASTLGVEAFLGAIPTPVAELARAIGDLVPDGPGWARAASPPISGPAPLTTADLLTEVTRAQSTPGQLALTHLEGTDRWIVALPGIHSLVETADPQNLPGALVAFSSGHGAYSRSVVDALTVAGVPLGAELLIVGHSQGGIIAADLAASPQVAQRWHITDVLTAGSPIDDVRIPKQTHLLAMDNVDDIVPSLDLHADASRSDRVTIRFRDERGGIGRNHDLADVYTATARSPGFTNDPEVRRWLAHASPYLAGGPATTQLFDLRDRPPAQS